MQLTSLHVTGDGSTVFGLTATFAFSPPSELLCSNSGVNFFGRRGSGFLHDSQAQYSSTEWEEILYEILGDRRMIDICADPDSPRVVICSTIINTVPLQMMLWRNYGYREDVDPVYKVHLFVVALLGTKERKKREREREGERDSVCVFVCLCVRVVLDGKPVTGNDVVATRIPGDHDFLMSTIIEHQSFFQHNDGGDTGSGKCLQWIHLYLSIGAWGMTNDVNILISTLLVRMVRIALESRWACVRSPVQNP